MSNRILVDRAARQVEVRNVLVEEPDQQAHQPALGLPLLAEKEHVVPGQQGQIDFRDDRVVVANDSRVQFVTRGQHAHEVVVHFVLDRFGHPAGPVQFTECRRKGGWARHGTGRLSCVDGPALRQLAPRCVAVLA